MMRKIFGMCFLGIAAFLAAIAAAAPVARAFTISGRITVVGGSGSGGVTVWIHSWNWMRTDSLGAYTLTGLWNEDYVIKVWAPHCLVSVLDTVEIRNADVAGVNDTIVAADIVEDGRINLYDAGELLRHYGATPDSASWNGALDFDGSGTIDSLDTAVLMSCWKDTSDVAPPSFLEVTEPTGATVWLLGQQNVPIQWNTGNLDGSVGITLVSGHDFVERITNSTPNDGSYTDYDVPFRLSPGSEYSISVFNADGGARSEYFEVRQRIIVTEPTSATVWNRGQANVPITWETGNLGGQVTITLYWGAGAYYQWSNVPNNGAYTVDVPAISVAPDHRILVSWDEDHRDFSDYFAIQDTNRVFVSAPDSGTVWAVGTRNGPIRWSTASLGLGRVAIDLYKGSNRARSIQSSAPNTGSYAAYDVPLSLPPGTDYRVFVHYAPNGSGGFSDSFEVRQYIIVTEPTSATVWNRGQANAAIKWNSGNLGGTVDIELYNGGIRARQWAGVSNNGAYSVAVPTDLLVGSDYWILVRWDASHADSSDYFTIRDTSVVVVTPNGNTAWMSGQQDVAIDWEWTSMTGSVSIDLYQGDGPVGTIASSTPNDGEYFEYDVPVWLTSGANYRVRIESDTGDFVFSDYFTIEHPSGWVWLYPSTGGNNLNAVCFTDANSGTAVGEYGTILRTTDGGATWVRQWGSTRKKLYGVDFIDANTGLAVGENGLILKTTDGGATWAGRRSGVRGGAFYSVAFADADTAVAVGWSSGGSDAHGLVFCRSTDGGETWTSSVTDYYTIPKSVSFLDAKIGAAAADGGRVYWTNDGGATWRITAAGWGSEPNNLAKGISVLDAETWVLVGHEFYMGWYGAAYRGVICLTGNAGVSWTRPYQNALVNAVSFADAATGTAVGQGGLILKTINGGVTWTPQTSGIGSDLSGVSFAGPGAETAVGAYGRIIGTTDGGSTWSLQTPSTAGYLMSIFFSNESEGMVMGGSGSSGVVLRTMDAGATWSSQETSGGALSDISMANADTGTVVGSYFEPCIDCMGWPGWSHGVILRTTDGGATWVQQKSLSTMLGCLWFTDPNTGIVFAWSPTAAASVLRTWDGGATWTSSSFAYKIEDVWFVDANTGIAVGGSGTIIRSVDGGATWTPQTSGTSNDLTCVHFLDANTGIAVGRSGTIIRSVDGGVTWAPLASGTARHLLGVRFIDANTGIAVGIDGMILRTTDGGSTWIRQDSGTTAGLWAVYLMDANTAIVAGEGGAILKTTTGGE